MSATDHATDHATIHGSPGEGARTAGIARAVFPLLVALFCIGYVAGAASGVILEGWTVGVILLLAGVLLLLGAASSLRRIAAFFKGAAGEEIVARELAHLPAGYHVFHSLDMGGGVLMWRHGDIDHVVVGPTGVYVIETKNWRGKVALVSGRLLVDGLAPRRAPLEQVRQAVAALQARLGRGGVYDVAVVPVVCFTGDSLEAASLTEGETIICGAGTLLDVLTRAKHQPPARVVDVAGVVRALADGQA